MPVVNHIDKKEQEMIIQALFGSVERYEECDNVKEIDKKLDFLVKLRNNLQRIPEWELDRIRWWQLYNWLAFALATLMFVPMMVKETENLIRRYRNHRPLAMPFVTADINKDYERFIKRNTKVITIIDQYVDKEKK